MTTTHHTKRIPLPPHGDLILYVSSVLDNVDYLLN